MPDLYPSGHLPDECCDEVRRFACTTLTDLAREVTDKDNENGYDNHDMCNETVVDVVVGQRVQMTRRGKILVATFDDGSINEATEVTVFNEVFETNHALFKEDEALIVQGSAHHDIFTGGVHVTVESVVDMAQACAKFAWAIRLSTNGDSAAAKLHDLLSPHVAAGGNGVSVHINHVCKQTHREAVLGDTWHIVPSEAAIAVSRQASNAENVATVYEQFEDDVGGAITGHRLGMTAVSTRSLLKHP